jgi:chromosome partitioning protein
MNTTLVVNAKGGVGKSTIATNLASYFAVSGVATAIMDYDPQGSSLHWLAQRPPEAPQIHGANGAPNQRVGLRSYAKYVPPTVRQLIIDSPAGPSRLLLQDLLNRASSIVIPVAPSVIDIQATAGFIKELLLVGGIRNRDVRVAVVANRVRSSMSVYEPLERFVTSLKLTFITRIMDSDVYIESAETGQGIFEMDPYRTADQRQEFLPLARWVAGAAPPEQPSSTNVVPLRHSAG